MVFDNLWVAACDHTISEDDKESTNRKKGNFYSWQWKYNNRDL